jgi:hypothetical protein
LGEIEFVLPARTNRPARLVRQTLHARTVEWPDGQGGVMPVSCLMARESGTRPGQKPIEWRLPTNRVIATLAQAAELIDGYRCRWEIETLFHVFKNGCRVEALPLGDIKKLELALYRVVAWRLAHLGFWLLTHRLLAFVAGRRFSMGARRKTVGYLRVGFLAAGHRWPYLVLRHYGYRLYRLLCGKVEE